MPSDDAIRHEHRLCIHRDPHRHPLVLRHIPLLVPDGKWFWADAAVATWHHAVWYLGLGDTMTNGAHRG